MTSHLLLLCLCPPGVFCILAGLLFGYDEGAVGALQVFFSLIGKFGASACFAIVYVYTGNTERQKTSRQDF